MDNVSRLYAFRFQQAEALAKEGKKEECLDICWDLRLKSNLSLYRRAHVNYLIATTVDVKKHPDAAKFAQECIDLVDDVLAQGFSNNPEALRSLAADAKRVKEEIGQKISELDKDKEKGNEQNAAGNNNDDDDDDDEDDEDWIELVDREGRQAKIMEALRSKYGPINQMAAKEEDSTQIEGIYTTDVDDADESISSASTEKAVEQLDGLTLGTKNTMDMPPTPPPSAQY